MTEATETLQEVIANSKGKEPLSELLVTRKFWNEVLFDLMDQPKEWDWYKPKHQTRDCFYFEGILITAEDEDKPKQPPLMKNQEELSKAYRTLSRKIALVIMSEMLSRDMSIGDIAFRINMDPDLLSGDFVKLINGYHFPNSLDFISDVLLAMDCEMDWSIIKPVSIPLEKKYIYFRVV